MTLRLTGALLCGGLLAFMVPAALAAKERKPPKGTDIMRMYGPEADRNREGRKVLVKSRSKRIFDRWGNQINLTGATDEPLPRMGRNPATGEKPKPQYDDFLK